MSYPAGFLSDWLGRRNILALLGSLFVLYGVYQGVFRAVGKTLALDLVSSRGDRHETW